MVAVKSKNIDKNIRNALIFAPFTFFEQFIDETKHLLALDAHPRLRGVAMGYPCMFFRQHLAQKQLYREKKGIIRVRFADSCVFCLSSCLFSVGLGGGCFFPNDNVCWGSVGGARPCWHTWGFICDHDLCLAVSLLRSRAVASAFRSVRVVLQCLLNT